MALTSASCLIICVLFCVCIADSSLGLPTVTKRSNTTTNTMGTGNNDKSGQSRKGTNSLIQRKAKASAGSTSITSSMTTSAELSQTSSINSTSLTSSSLKTSNATGTPTTTETVITTSTASQSISKPTLPSTTAKKSSSLSQEGELAIIVVCVMVGTGMIIALVAGLSCMLNKQKTLDYSSKKSYVNGSVKSGPNKDSSYELQDLDNTTDSVPSTSYMPPRLSTEDTV